MPGLIQVLTVKEAAEMMGLGTDTVQAGLIQGVFPWGYAIRTGEHRYRYWINAAKFFKTEEVKKHD